MLRLAFAALLALHGAIHLLGFVKGYGLSEVAALKRPIGRVAGALWLLAAAGFLAASALLLASSGRWWLAGLPALLLSQALIVGAWSDARFGTVANAIVAIPLVLALLQASPASLGAAYRREAARALAGVARGAPLVTEQDLEGQPPLVQAWLRRVGVVGRPHVQGFRARFHGRLRNGLDAPWMDFTSEQVNVVDPSARLFRMEASLRGLPFEAFHAFRGREARMRVRAAFAVDVVDARGEQLGQSETVTVFNDLCVLAPAALLDAPVRWTPLDARSVRGAFTREGRTVSAVLTFDEAGDLVGFRSEDRLLSADGKTFERLPWSTPLRGHRAFGGVRLPAVGEAVWETPRGDLAYGEFHLDGITSY